MKKQEIGKLLYKEVEKIYNNKQVEIADQITALNQVLNYVFIESTKEERMHFTTLFARISYIFHRFDIPKKTQLYVYQFRKLIRKLGEQNAEEKTLVLQIGLKSVAECIESLFDVPMSEEIKELLPPAGFFRISPVEIKKFVHVAKVVVLKDDAEKEQLIAKDEANPANLIRIQYNIADRNYNFNPTIHEIKNTFRFPLTINLIDVEIDIEGIYRPKAFVIEPDYLVDVTAVADCFKDFGAEPILHLLKRFLPFVANRYIMVGHIANYFLDELMTRPNASFDELFPQVFRLNPLAFTLFDNAEVTTIMQASAQHYRSLKAMVITHFEKNGIDTNKCLLEPSFYSQRYGIQGRLDVFCKSDQPAIVELKSGKAYRPNQYGISHNHYTQTLLYDLIIHSVYNNEIKPTNFILYSGLDYRSLRFAPTIKAQQYEAIQCRNQLLSFEQHLINIKEGDLNNPAIFTRLSPERIPKATGFIQRDLQAFAKIYNELAVLERKYLNAFTSFIAREHRICKTGIQGVANANGLASLWLDTFTEKEENFDIISFLTILENNTTSDQSLIVLRKTERSNPLANFRNGDIAILYPYLDSQDAVLRNQIFKCSIIKITKEEVVIRLRAKQSNIAVFEEYTHWNLEHDLLDSGFNNMYRSLFAFTQATPDKKALLLTTAAPRQPQAVALHPVAEFTREQQTIFQKIIAAQDYFLLWGPPGTGKTSIMLKNLVDYLFHHTEENILLMAYTNRAVDEICAAIESISPEMKDKYLRIGSRYSTAEAYREQLLDVKMESIRKRKELGDLLQKHRIFVSTVSSISGKTELLLQKQFDTVIIDEASQILEPMLVGLLPQFKRFVLIGDHKQLPAVVTQSPEDSAIKDSDLNAVGLNNLRDSLFERLYKRSRHNDWDWTYAQLSHQGRMHADIMSFPNQYFYEQKLQILPQEVNYHKKQLQTIDYKLPVDAQDIDKQLCENRMLFISTPVDDTGTSNKNNQYEARLVATLIKRFEGILAYNELNFEPKTLGVITPYRAQIATILNEFQERGIDSEKVSVDTVERYQGGARDIIIISLCTNRLSQLDGLVSLSEEGVDRKLNVALTRARRHLIIVGNIELLQTNDIYNDLIHFCKKIKMEEVLAVNMKSEV